MKLGTQTGSLVNHMMASTDSKLEIKAGTPVTILSWSDRKPGTVFRTFMVGNTEIIEVREDDYKRIDNNGMSEQQEYEYKINVNGSKHFYRASKKGGYEGCYQSKETGRWVKGSGFASFGHREAYFDFSF